MKIDFMEKKIVVTKKFLERASHFDTEEFRELIMVKNEFPYFQIVQKPVAHCNSPLKGLTYSKMEYIIRTEGEDDDLNQFRYLRSMGCNYGTVSKWFLTRYPSAINICYTAA